jgi:hypothetical protein
MRLIGSRPLGRVEMPEHQADAIPNLKALERALALGIQAVSLRNRIFVREPKREDLDASDTVIA